MDALSGIFPFLTATLFSGALYLLSNWLQREYRAWVQRRTCSLRLESSTHPGWPWFLAWVTEQQPRMARQSHHVRMRTAVGREYDFQPADTVEPMRFLFGGRAFELTVGIVEKEQRSDNNVYTYNAGGGSAPMYALLTTRGGDTSVFRPLIDAMRDAHTREQQRVVTVAVNGSGGVGRHWQPVRTMLPRPWSSLILAPDMLRDMQADLARFIDPRTRDRYRRLCVPYRRGWLLHGPPGNGKSSLLVVLASQLRTRLDMLSLSDASLTDAALADAVNASSAFSATPDAVTLLALEDVDALFRDRSDACDGDADDTPDDTETAAGDGKKADTAARRGVTLAGLLAVLDGPCSPENILIVMTTNYPERLDAALCRPGRVDRRFEFAAPTDDLLRAMYARFNPTKTPADTRAFVARCRADPGTLSLARAQELARSEADADDKEQD